MISKLKKFVNKIEPSNDLWLLKIIAILRLFFGFFTNIYKSKPLSYVIKLYCITVSTALNAFYYTYFIRSNRSYFFVFLEYTITVIVYLVFADEKFWNYCSAIKTSDKIMSFKKIPLIPSYVHLIIFINALMRVFIAVIRSIHNSGNVYVFCSITLVVTSLDLNQITIIIIFSIMQSRIKQLKMFLNKISVPINIAGKNEVAVSIKNIRKSLYNYNNLLDNMTYVDKQLKYLVNIL